MIDPRQKFGKTNIKFDLNILREETSRIIELFPIDNRTHQLAITHRKNAAEPFYDGVGSLYDFESNRFHSSEKDFSEFNSELRGTYFEEIYRHVVEWSPFQIGRVRIMRLNPKSCLSMHKDTDIRFHIPIVTNPQCYMIFMDSLPIHLPADGHLYWTNTLGLHSVINGHNSEARLHLVFSTYSETTDDYYDFIKSQEVSGQPPGVAAN